MLERARKWNLTSTNDGGWAESVLNTILNTRLYNAMPTQIKLLLKQMKVRSSDGIISPDGTQRYTAVTESNCYITIPALVEVCDKYIDVSPYSGELNALDGTKKTISFMNTNSSRKRAYDDEVDGSEYWTRSPNATSFATSTSSSYNNYVWRVAADGAVETMQGITNPSSAGLGVLIEISF